jgi:hypothetical protein
MTDQEHNAIEKSVDDAIRSLMKKRLGRGGADLWDRIGSAYPRAEGLPTGTAVRKRVVLRSLLLARQRSLSHEGLPESIQWAVRDDDQLFFRLLGEVFASPPLDNKYASDRQAWFLVENWLERTPVRLRDRKLLVSLRRPSNRISAGNPLPGLCQFTDSAIAEYFALVRRKEFGGGLRGVAESLEVALTKKRQRLGLKSASKKLVRGVKVEGGEIVLIPFDRVS